MTYVFRGKFSATGEAAVTRFVPGNNSALLLQCLEDDLSLSYHPFYQALSIDGSAKQLCNELCLFAQEQCRQPARGFEVKSVREWDELSHWEDPMPIDMSEQMDDELWPCNSIEQRSVRWFLFLARALGAREARENSRFDAFIPLRAGSRNAGKYLGIQLKSTDHDDCRGERRVPRLSFGHASGEDGLGYPGQLVIFISLNRGLIWMKPGVEVGTSVSIYEADQDWRKFYVERGTFAKRLRQIVSRLGLKAFTREQIDKAPTETHAIEGRQIDFFKGWTGLNFDCIARMHHDAKINGRKVQFKTTELKRRAHLVIGGYCEHDFEVLVLISPHRCWLIPSSDLAKRGLVDNELSNNATVCPAYDEKGCTGTDWIREYAIRFDDEGRQRVRAFFGVDQPIPSLPSEEVVLSAPRASVLGVPHPVSSAGSVPRPREGVVREKEEAPSLPSSTK